MAHSSTFARGSGSKFSPQTLHEFQGEGRVDPECPVLGVHSLTRLHLKTDEKNKTTVRKLRRRLSIKNSHLEEERQRVGRCSNFPGTFLNSYCKTRQQASPTS